MEQTPPQTPNQQAPQAMPTQDQPQQSQPKQSQSPASTQPQTPSAAPACKCPVVSEVDWDKKKMQLDKTFYKTFSPRLFYLPFSFAIDVARARTAALSMGYKPVDNGMILDTGGMFLANIMVEVTEAKDSDPNVLSLKGKEVYTKVSKRPWKEIKMDMMELEKELGKKPAATYLWYTSCLKCMGQKEIKTVLIAVS